MKTRILLALIALLAFAAAPSPGVAQEKDEAAPAAKSDFQALQVKLAETRVQLAELELNVARQQNRQDAGLVPTVVIESLELSLAKAKAQLAGVHGDEKALREALSTSADTNVKIAAARFARLKDFADKGGSLVKSDLDRAQMRVTIAEIERDSLAGLLDQPVEVQLRWQVDRIHAAIDSLMDRVIVLEDKR